MAPLKQSTFEGFATGTLPGGGRAHKGRRLPAAPGYRSSSGAGPSSRGPTGKHLTRAEQAEYQSDLAEYESDQEQRARRHFEKRPRERAKRAVQTIKERAQTAQAAPAQAAPQSYTSTTRLGGGGGFWAAVTLGILIVGYSIVVGHWSTGLGVGVVIMLVIAAIFPPLAIGFLAVIGLYLLLSHGSEFFAAVASLTGASSSGAGSRQTQTESRSGPPAGGPGVGLIP